MPENSADRDMNNNDTEPTQPADAPAFGNSHGSPQAQALGAEHENMKAAVLGLHSKGKTPKQIAAHYSIVDFNLSESEIADIIESSKGRFVCCLLCEFARLTLR